MKTLSFPLAETRMDRMRVESIRRIAERVRCFGDKDRVARLGRDGEYMC